MNKEVLPTFEAHEAWIDTVLSNNGREFCGLPDQHPYGCCGVPPAGDFRAQL